MMSSKKALHPCIMLRKVSFNFFYRQPATKVHRLISEVREIDFMTYCMELATLFASNILDRVYKCSPRLVKESKYFNLAFTSAK